jgi:hypothetical protein
MARTLSAALVGLPHGSDEFVGSGGRRRSVAASLASLLEQEYELAIVPE